MATRMRRCARIRLSIVDLQSERIDRRSGAEVVGMSAGAFNTRDFVQAERNVVENERALFWVADSRLQALWGEALLGTTGAWWCSRPSQSIGLLDERPGSSLRRQTPQNRITGGVLVACNGTIGRAAAQETKIAWLHRGVRKSAMLADLAIHGRSIW